MRLYNLAQFFKGILCKEAPCFFYLLSLFLDLYRNLLKDVDVEIKTFTYNIDIITH